VVDANANLLLTQVQCEGASVTLSAGRLRGAINGRFLQTKQALEKDKWLYVVGIFDGKQMALYVDGALRASLDETRGSVTG
jgi:hypothetical protein